MGGVLSSSFPPSHGVFTALWLSLATWFPCQALLPSSTLTTYSLRSQDAFGREREPLRPGPIMSATSHL